MADSLLSAQLSAVAATLGTGSGRDTSPTRAGPSAATVIPHRRVGITNSSWSLPDTWKGHRGDTGADHFTSACCGVWYLPSEHLALAAVRNMTLWTTEL